MSCNSCSKPFSLLRREKGCPNCGFSYCSNCLKYKMFIPKINNEAKVCARCERSSKLNENKKIEPPDAYYKRIQELDNKCQTQSGSQERTFVTANTQDQEIADRLNKLKADRSQGIVHKITNDDIAARLQRIKGEVPSVSDKDLQTRLANIKGVPVSAVQSKPFVYVPDNRTEQEQADDLMKQYMEQANIDGNYQADFDGVIDDIQNRLQKLKNPSGTSNKSEIKQPDSSEESEDEDEMVKKIIEQAEKESRLEDIKTSNSDPSIDLLSLCEICDKYGEMHCLGCKYLLCRRCFNSHMDADYGCDKYEPYKLNV